jgi:hypothetical protein
MAMPVTPSLAFIAMPPRAAGRAAARAAGRAALETDGSDSSDEELEKI